ncbi:hypothetical protein PM082_023433 [Marasmius tenuissimus]|nr:hypothetical protein PM082_023433 [Marasmius tenuissimus]
MAFMDAFNYRPESVLSPMLAKRNNPGGLYEHVFGVVHRMGKNALCQAEYDVDFFRRSADNWSANFSYRRSDNTDFSTNIFGEIMGGRYGTLLGPKGNHYPGPNPEDPNHITDSTPVKQVIVLGSPSFCPPALAAYFRNQVVVLDNMRHADAREEMEDQVTFDVKEIIKGYAPEEEPCLITLHSSQLYTVEKENGSPTKPASRKPMQKRHANGSSVGATEQVTEDASPQPSNTDTRAINLEDAARGRPFQDHELPGVDRIWVGAKYSPWVIPGYGGNRFRQRIAQTIQLDWRTVKGDLIPPWKVWDELRPGTLIMANVVFHIYVMPARDPLKSRKKVYQAVIKTIRVLGRSDIEVSKPVRDQESFAGSASSNTAAEHDDAAFQALSELVLPDDNDEANPETETSDRGTNESESVAEEATHGKAAGESGNVVYLEDLEDVATVNTKKSKKARRM